MITYILLDNLVLMIVLVEINVLVGIESGGFVVEFAATQLLLEDDVVS